jgi:hypothetical protein
MERDSGSEHHHGAPRDGRTPAARLPVHDLATLSMSVVRVTSPGQHGRCHAPVAGAVTISVLVVQQMARRRGQRG